MLGETTSALEDGRRDFDFLIGSWRINNRRLRERLSGSNDWEEFTAQGSAHLLLGGLANQDDFRVDDGSGFIGMSFRFFNPASKQWAIYWADNRQGVLQPPVYGRFVAGVGTFIGADSFAGKQILCRFIWSRTETPTPRWEQAFSEDGGTTWETNWFMDFSPLEA